MNWLIILISVVITFFIFLCFFKAKDVKAKSLIKRIENPQTNEIEEMGGGAGSVNGTGGMATKISAAKIATNSGVDMIIANSSYDNIIERILNAEKIGTLFIAENK